MLEVVLVAFVMYNYPDGRIESKWEEVRQGFTTITECQNYADSVNKTAPINRLTCIQRYRANKE